MKRYPKYKDSGVEWIGEIPEHWEVKRLKYMSDVRFSSVDRHIKNDELTVSVCHYPDVYYNEKINYKTKLNIGSCSEQEYEKYQLRKDNVIITKDSESPDDIGVAVFVEENMKETVCGYHLALISTTGDELSGGFLFRFIQSDKVGRYFEIHSNGITRFGLGKPFIENLFVTLLINSEQEKIITYLDHKTHLIDTLIEKKQKQIELLKEQRTAIINHAVTKGLNPNVKMKDSGIEWLGEIPAHWNVKRFKYFFSLITEKNHSNENGKKIALENIESWTGRLLETDSKFEGGGILFLEGDILFGKLRPYLAKVLYIDFSGSAVGDIYVFRPVNGVDSKFGFYRLLNKSFIDIVNSATYGAKMPRASWNFIGDLKIAIPTMSEQIEIVRYIENIPEIDTITTKTEKQIDLLKEYRTTLISDAVTGKIDVRDEVPS